jgi:signal transduction histidine kinase
MWGYATMRYLARFFQSVRFRLTLWYLALLALILLGFGLTVYYAQQSYISAQFDDLLRTRIQQIALTYDASTQRLDITQPILEKPTATNISAATRGLNSGEVAVLFNPQGKALQEVGDITPAGFTEMAGLTLKESGGATRSSPAHLPDASLASASSGKMADYGFISMPIFQQQQVVAYLTFGAPSNVAQQLRALATTLLVVGALVLLLAAVGGFWLANRAMRPVQAIAGAAEQIGSGDLSRRLALKRRDELGELAGAFDHMLDRLENAFIRQRRFTADASHELRTPLTIIELEADRLLDQPDTTERQRAALTLIQQERQHMARLVDDLLFLARGDAGYVGVRHEIVHLDELVLEVVERFAPLSAQRHARIEVDALPDLTVRGDRLYLARMLGALVENALKYGVKDGGSDVAERSDRADGVCVRIALAQRERDGAEWAYLTISDDGPGIAAEHLPRIFERFYRADTARTHALTSIHERAGSGLGLAIARGIAQAHGGDIALHSDVGQGVVCAIALPLLVRR